MSRNKEKAQSALNRYQAQVSKDAGVLDSDPSQRPKYVQSVERLPQAEKWRQTVVTEISVKLTQINDPTLPEHEIRVLNDSLNKLHREKRAWEYHIKSLGGNDYISYGGGIQGINVRGTRYYGRARELAEVKQMASGAKSEETLKKKTVALDYYGVYDGEWTEPIRVDREGVVCEVNTALGEEVLPGRILESGDLLTGGDLPTSEDVERWMVDRKRKELMAQLGL